MKRPALLISVLILMISGVISAETPWSYSVGASGMDYTWTDNATGNLIQEQMFGLDIRGSAIVKPTGFYYGTYLSFGIPVYTWEFDSQNDITRYYDSTYDFYTSFGIPFGYRWVLPRGLSGAYLGAGPSFQALLKFREHMRGSGGMFVEFGIESLREKGIGWSFGTRLMFGWGSFETDGEYFMEQPAATSSSLFVGLSWKGTRGN